MFASADREYSKKFLEPRKLYQIFPYSCLLFLFFVAFTLCLSFLAFVITFAFARHSV